MTSSADSDTATKVGSRYALVIAVSKRAREIRDGAMPLVETTSSNPISIALREFTLGKLKIHYPTPEEQAAREEEVLSMPRERDRELAEAVDLLRAPVHEETGEESEESEEDEAEELSDEIVVAAEPPASESQAEEEEPPIVEE